MRTFTALAVFCLGVVLAGSAVRTAAPPEQTHAFIDAERYRGKFTRTINITKLRERLVDAGRHGYQVEHVSVLSTSMSMLLRHDGGMHAYQLLTASGEEKLVGQLNEASAKGFRLVPSSLKALEEYTFGARQTTWVAVVEQRPDAPRATYTTIKGTKPAEAALAEADKAGRTLVAIVGRQGMVSSNVVLFFEQADGGSGSPSAPPREYAILATGLTSTLQKELSEHAGKGFRLVDAGTAYLLAVMARAGDAVAPAAEYRLLAMIQVKTGIRELNAAGADGFRLRAVSENGNEAVFIMERTLGGPARLEYELVSLEEATAEEILLKAESEGYGIARLLNDIVLLERPASVPSPTTGHRPVPRSTS